MWLHLTRADLGGLHVDDGRVMINSENVAYIEPWDSEGTRIVMVDQAHIRVSETFAQVEAMLRGKKWDD
ncbi:hypothetical protein KGP36_06850 [Patescibacteria group bacterium]|nr:hypothetical protein [Patescibacteria group bacterium]